jgi:hypothetical protein
MASPWIEPRNRAPAAAAAREPTPSRSLRPLSAMNAVQALWRRIKNRLVRLITHDRRFVVS